MLEFAVAGLEREGTALEAQRDQHRVGALAQHRVLVAALEDAREQRQRLGAHDRRLQLRQQRQRPERARGVGPPSAAGA